MKLLRRKFFHAEHAEVAVKMHENEITGKVIDICYHIHRHLGPGLLESVYEDIKLEIGFRADIIVEKKVIIEIKSVEELTPVHFKQLLTYLRLSGIKVGLLINFNKELLKDGIKRIVNNL
jgi:hypothetical protein